MSSRSPSRLRREGREAFFRGGDPADFNPYTLRTPNSDHWLDGWSEAKKADDLAIAREEQAEIDDIDKVQEFARLYNLAKEQGLIT